MPEPIEAVHGVQDANIAPAPQGPADNQTTTQSGKAIDAKGVMDFLDIPLEVQKQVAPKAEEAKPGTKPPEEEPPAEPETELEFDEKDEGEEEDIPPAAEEEHPQKVDKRQKRINRLTRQRNEALDQAEEYRRKLEAVEGKAKAATPSDVIPSATPWLRHITSERTLKTEVARAEAVIDWCDNNPEGEALGDDSIDIQFKEAYDLGELTKREALAKTVAKWRRESDKVVRGAPMRIEEIREYNGDRMRCDALAREYWPELFDKKTEDYQHANSLLEQFPFLKGMPQGNYAVGLLIEGAKTLQSKIDKRQGTNGQRRDISQRAFEPRVPLAPHTAEPLSRQVVPSSQKQLNEAMSSLVKDPDGSAPSLAAAFAAMDKNRRTRATSRTSVPV